MSGSNTTRTSLGEMSPRYNALRIQTSTRGMVIPVIFGTTRVTGNLLWIGDFRAVQHTTYSRQVGGGKGGGTTRVYTTRYSYTYEIAFAMGLCEGPISAILAMWENKYKHSLLPSDIYIFEGSYPQDPWTYLVSNHPVEALNYPGICYIAFSAFDTGDQAMLPEMNFEVSGLGCGGILPMELVSNGNFALGDPPTNWPAYNNPDVYERSFGRAGLGDNYSAYVLDSTPSYGGFRQLISTLPNGTIKFSFWCYVFQGVLDAILYDNDGLTMIARTQVTTLNQWIYVSIFGVSWKSGASPIARFTSYWDTAVSEFKVTEVSIRVADVDANPGDIITTIIADPHFGLGITGGAGFGLGLSTDLLDSAEYRVWCRASGFMLSPAFSEQAMASEQIKRILDETFATAIYHDGSTLKLIPYADAITVGKDVTYTPNVTPLYDLDDDDFLVDGVEDPIIVKRKSPADCYNAVKIECLNRGNDYNPETIDAFDQGAIDAYILRQADSQKMWDICNIVQARKLAQLILQRGLYIRNEYQFKLGWKFCLLEPMGIVTLTDSNLGMDKYPVRILEIEEDEEWRLSIIAEDFPEGIGNAAQYETQHPQSYGKDWNVEPGNVDEPFIFIPPSDLWWNPLRPEIWVGANGSDGAWGGCDIYASSDGETYGYVGTILGRSRMGVLTALLPAGSDPDLVNVCSVDLSESQGQLVSGSQSEADNLITLCAIKGTGLEMISYQTATLTGAHLYDLSYLRRGQKTSQPIAHPAGSRFVRIDDLVAKLVFDQLWLHSTIYFKFCSFNIYKLNVQSLSDVVEYSFLVQTPLAEFMVGTDSATVIRRVTDSGTGADSISVSK